MRKILQKIWTAHKTKLIAYLACASLSACAGTVTTPQVPTDTRDLLNGRPELHIEPSDASTYTYWTLEILVEGHPRYFPGPMILRVCTFDKCQNELVPVNYLRYYHIDMVPVRPPNPFGGRVPLLVALLKIKGINPITGQAIPMLPAFLESQALLHLQGRF